MFNLFNKKNNSVNTEVGVKEFAKKSTNEIIEEIHESFYSEVDKLLASAKISNSLETNHQELIDKCKRLKALGFTNTKEVKEAEIEIERLNKLRQENEAKKSLIEAINYFSFKYPNYKFITEESVKKICSKYGLIYGSSSLYIGTIPNVNLKHIEDFKIDSDDDCHVEQDIFYSSFGDSRIQRTEYLSGKKIRLEKEEKEKRFKNGEYPFDELRINYSPYFRLIKKMCELEIAAPIKDFNTKGMEVENFKLEAKPMEYDPIVLKPVFFNNQKHYLIVTAWGLEASDELVVNQKMN